MLLLHVKHSKKGTHIEVQNGDKSYRSRDLNLDRELTFYVKECVAGMLSSASVGTPVLNLSIPETEELKSPLKSGVGLSDDHRQLIKVEDGKVTVLDEGPRWLIADALKIHVAKALANNEHLKGNL